MKQAITNNLSYAKKNQQSKEKSIKLKGRKKKILLLKGLLTHFPIDHAKMMNDDWLGTAAQSCVFVRFFPISIWRKLVHFTFQITKFRLFQQYFDFLNVDHFFIIATNFNLNLKTLQCSESSIIPQCKIKETSFFF